MDNHIPESSFPQETDMHIHLYKLSEEEPTTEELKPTGGDDEWTAACDNLTLPHSTLDGVWESLILAPGIKHLMLEHALSALLFSDKVYHPILSVGIDYFCYMGFLGPERRIVGTQVGHSSGPSLSSW
jgi:hypothetical protein